MGVAICLKERIPDHRIIIKSETLELLWLEVNSNRERSFYMISWVRPPTGETDTGTFENLREFLVILDWDEK